MEPDFKDRDAFDPDERELCPDGSCTGLLGADGRCKVCGAAGDGSARRAPSGAHDDGWRVASAGGDDDHQDGAFDDDDRKLCPDGACTGLLGSDGKCKVCGAAA